MSNFYCSVYVSGIMNIKRNIPFKLNTDLEKFATAEFEDADFGDLEEPEISEIIDCISCDGLIEVYVEGKYENYIEAKDEDEARDIFRGMLLEEYFGVLDCIDYDIEEADISPDEDW